jgi:hypothetical protein
LPLDCHSYDGFLQLLLVARLRTCTIVLIQSCDNPLCIFFPSHEFGMVCSNGDHRALLSPTVRRVTSINSFKNAVSSERAASTVLVIMLQQY